MDEGRRAAQAGTPKVVITLPAYRSEHTLERTIADVPEGSADLFIVVDDASPDGTVRKARELGLRVVVHDENRGYGGNQKTCYVEALDADADVVVLLHPDYQYDPRAVPLLIAPILSGDADMTFGSRFAGLGDPMAGGMPAYRFVGNRFTTVIENLMLGSRFTDLHSGMRAYTRRCLLSVPFQSYTNDFAFDTQFLVDAVTSGLRVVEVPIPTRYTKESSSIRIGPSLRYVGSSIGYTAKRSLQRGRRGRRSPLTMNGRRRGRYLRGGTEESFERTCVLCRDPHQRLVYPANSSDPVSVRDFACTSDGLGRHDDILQCRRCGLVSSAPSFSLEEMTRNYEQVVDHDYLLETTARRELFAWVTQRLGHFPVRGRRLLEVGAGSGLFLDVAREAGWDARGLEPSTWAVTRGREAFGVNLQHGVVEDLDESSGSFDAVVMLDVLEHLIDPPATLRTLRAILDREGLLVLSTVNVEGRHARLRRGDWPWFMHSHLFYFDAATVAATLTRADFDLVGWYNVPRTFRLSYLARRLRLDPGVVDAISAFADPRIPTAWMQDLSLVVARPR